ncbi:hypothetical protein L207DRAFT_426513 [Hyaloscypha variabilis F]|uniref:Uncharacterized protein n=1 Tax=Hyaloscypha variabilis (strain UAMH 11265 / GT02V1 / F) TaxID=1149755 RepID=A0A2J6RSM9_HYAVF|nr:hypothetical protein L207DRAFT_426513 [Hyaloscypha variabilis F]
MNPFYSSTTLSSSTSDLNNFNNTSEPLSPRLLYAQSFDRPSSARSLPSSKRYRKNMKEMTGFGTTEEEFEALPIAVRRKYFSTLERLRFAERSRTTALSELPIQSHRKSSLADRRGINVALIEPRRKLSTSRRLRNLSRQQSVSSNEASWFLTLPEKIKKKQFTREEQVVLAARLRESVILDAADEAIYKASRRASRNLTPLSFSSPRSPQFEHTPTNHNRQKSRALSLISPKHGAHESVSSIDPNAKHYQDPEARLKLRVYLASPQKFDEAIEFGFPSINGVTDGDKENKPPKRFSKDLASAKKSSSTEKSFLADDNASLFEDDVSMNEPDSPITPLYTESRSQSQALVTPVTRGSKTSSDYTHLGITKPTLVKQPESYAQAMAGNREMTLRMTLTRPDLRADESAIYGWQATKSPLREASPTIEEDEKFAVKGPLGGNDGWGPIDKEDGVVKRFWNKMKSTQRKTS